MDDKVKLRGKQTKAEAAGRRTSVSSVRIRSMVAGSMHEEEPRMRQSLPRMGVPRASSTWNTRGTRVWMGAPRASGRRLKKEASAST